MEPYEEEPSPSSKVEETGSLELSRESSTHVLEPLCCPVSAAQVEKREGLDRPWLLSPCQPPGWQESGRVVGVEVTHTTSLGPRRAW